MTRKAIKEWIKERDEVAKTYDVDLFKAFYAKWQARGLYNMKLPPDKVIEVSLRKMVCNMASATEEEKQEAEKWLLEHGSSPSLS